ncbi:MAG: superoxide dismutase family protein [Bacteroidales bacterium]|nr:superoxide dismutase family protein [Bacteroidales bacterium]MCF8344901.1 superoxide dismutase family protein [Bacteroidales bacterium]MCF8350001.1 superoxide dismutase family protein [Bacteroidales bacterium]MCF8376370.1 superoxide dismutase family protein [Bacteroidales bacterium]MCF8400536.1 superoxide dismutase family protein [Bacteroidales bacterium]
MKSFKSISSFFAIVLMVILAGCQAPQPVEQKDMQEPAAPEIDKAICVLHPTEGSEAHGTVWFEKTGDGIHVKVEMHGLEEGKHGFHIHAVGDCSAADGTSAGGHFNPQDKKHGGPADSLRHVGDLGNITADENGDAKMEMTDTLISFHGENSIIGRGVIVHAGMDDLTSQPTGDAGARVACGVIGIDE